MGKDRKKLQKKKAQKAAKNKARKVQQRKRLIQSGTFGKMSLRGAFQAPIYQCWEAEHMFSRDRGIGSVVVTRKTQRRDILMAVFLLDVYCLGVKNAYVKLMSEEEYRARLNHMRSHEGLKAIPPSCARKLVEDAEEYARSLGFAPHKDYQSARKIFGDIQKDECSRTFEFGRDGKPLYFAGPYDSEAFRRRVVNTLMDKLGPEGFDYIMPLDDPDSLFE